MKRLFSLTAVILCIVMMLSLIPMGVCAAEFTGDDRIVIVLDPGHGTGGVADETNLSEGAFNMRTAKYMKAALEANSSFVVYMTNEADNVNLSFYERVSKADAVNADLIISVHYNASESNPNMRGMEVWSSVLPEFAMDELGTMFIEYATQAVPEIPGRGVYHRKDSEGYYWNETYQWDVQGDASSGVLSDHYSIITYGAKFGIPTFIIEELYLTNADDFALATDANIKAVAEAQAQAIIDYYTDHEHTYGEMKTDIPLSCVSAGKQSRHCSICGHRKDVGTVASAPDSDGHFYQPIDINEPKGAWYCVYTRSLKEKAKLNIEEHTGDSLEGIDVPAPVPPADTPDDQPVTAPPVTNPVEPPKGEDGHTHNYRVTGGFEVAGGGTGSAIYTCTICNDKYTETLYASYDCEKNGHILMAYSLVGKDFLPAGFELPHVDTEPTCESEGKTYSFCMVCSYAGDDTTPALGHTLEELNRVEAECNKEGIIESGCTVCNKRITEKIPALTHDMQTVEHIEATADSEGKKVERCTHCNAEETVIIPKLSADTQIEFPSGTNDPAVTETSAQPKASSLGDKVAEYAEKIHLPLPLIAFIIMIVLLVAAVIVIPLVIRRRRETAEVEIAAMNFSPEEVAVPQPANEEDEDIVANVIPEIAQVVEGDVVDAGFSIENIEIPVEANDMQTDDSHREDAVEALKQSFVESEKE